MDDDFEDGLFDHDDFEEPEDPHDNFSIVEDPLFGRYMDMTDLPEDDYNGIPFED